MHATLPGSFLALPLAVAAGAAVIAEAAPPERREAATRAPPVEMEVLGVVPLDDDQASMLVLVAKGAQTFLTLVIGRNEAMAIELRLRDAAPPRPLTHDLLDHTIEALGGHVVAVEIDSLENDVFRAKIRVAQGSRKLEIDARPSDSVALALRSRAPIFASRRVLDDAGLTKADVERLRRKHGDDRQQESRPARTQEL